MELIGPRGMLAAIAFRLVFLFGLMLLFHTFSDQLVITYDLPYDLLGLTLRFFSQFTHARLRPGIDKDRLYRW
jgi:hypothetical protein